MNTEDLCEDYYKGFCTRPDVPQSWCKYKGKQPDGRCEAERKRERSNSNATYDKMGWHPYDY